MRHNIDVIFYFGDLNFRLDLPRRHVMNWINETHYPAESPHILYHDQLKKLQDNDLLLQGLSEVVITFPPTYKYDCGSQVLDSSNKKRTPSYTDRILYGNKFSDFLPNIYYKLPKHKEATIGVIYDSIRHIRLSDHKPVYGIYRINIEPDKDM